MTSSVHHSRVATLINYSMPLAFALLPTIARADGGAVRAVERHGVYQIAAFTSPVPLVVGPADISVLLQCAETFRVVEDADVSVTVFPVDHPQERIVVQATRAAATNKLFQAALVELSAPGTWRATIECRAGDEHFETTFDFDVGAGIVAGPHLWRWYAWPWAVVAVFIAHQCLAARKRPHRPGTRARERLLSN